MWSRALPNATLKRAESSDRSDGLDELMAMAAAAWERTSPQLRSALLVGFFALLASQIRMKVESKSSQFLPAASSRYLLQLE